MTAASMGGVIASTAPGAKVTTPPFSDAFTRADGDPGQPWFNPRCDVPILGIVSDTLQASNENYPRCRAGLLLNSGDFDVTFTFTFSALRAGVRDDLQFWFHCSPCQPPDDGTYPAEAYGVTTQPNVTGTLTGSHGVSLYRQSGTTTTLVALSDNNTVHEGETHSLRVRVVGSTCYIYLDNLTAPCLAYTTLDALTGQHACFFVAGKLLSSIDDVAFSAPSSTGYEELIVADGAQLYWPMQESSGTICSDAVSDVALTEHSTVTVGGGTAPFAAQARSVSYGGGYMDFTFPTALAVAPSAFSWECWFYLNSNTGFHGPLKLGFGGSEVYNRGGLNVLRCDLFNSLGTPFTLDSPALGASFTGHWHHLVLTWALNTLSMYYDGALVSSMATTGTLAAPSTGQVGESGNPWDGYLADAAFYPTALTATQVNNHFNAA